MAKNIRGGSLTFTNTEGPPPKKIMILNIDSTYKKIMILIIDSTLIENNEIHDRMICVRALIRMVIDEKIN